MADKARKGFRFGVYSTRGSLLEKYQTFEAAHKGAVAYVLGSGQAVNVVQEARDRDGVWQRTRSAWDCSMRRTPSGLVLTGAVVQ